MMTPDECRFEEEVLAAVTQLRWPGRVDSALREHVAGCAICSELAEAAMAIGDLCEEMRGAASIPDSGRVWWVAQLRARREAVKDAGRPITAVQVIAFACAAGLVGACFGATSAWFQLALGRISSSMAGLDLGALVIEHGALAAAMAVLLLLVPAAVYLAMGRD
jgi:hypothetical protein